MRKKLCAFILSAVLMGNISISVAADPYEDQINNQQNNLNKQKNEINQQKNGLNEQKTLFQQAEREVEQLQTKIEQLDFKIEGLMREIDKTNGLITSKEENIQDAQVCLYKAEEDINMEQNLFDKRMRSMYINGSDSYIDVVFSSKGLAELISNIELLRNIAQYDKKIISELNDKKMEVQLQKSALEKEKEVLISLRGEKEDKLSTVKNSKSNQDKLVKEAKKKRQYYASTVSEYNEKVKRSQKMINDTLKKIEQIKASIPKRDPSRGTTSVSENEIVAFASKYLGTPYVWGAEGPKYFDCSGFVQYVYAHFGVSLYRVTYDQVKQGTYVARDKLKPGDLVFFGTKWNVHHVGMYVGNNCYIHAPQTGDVIKISALTRRDYYTARRVLP